MLATKVEVGLGGTRPCGARLGAGGLQRFGRRPCGRAGLRPAAGCTLPMCGSAGSSARRPEIAAHLGPGGRSWSDRRSQRGMPSSRCVQRVASRNRAPAPSSGPQRRRPPPADLPAGARMPGRRADISSIPTSPAAARASRRAVLSPARGLPAGRRPRRQAGERRPDEAMPQLASWATSPGLISAAAPGAHARALSGGGTAACPWARMGLALQSSPRCRSGRCRHRGPPPGTAGVLATGRGATGRELSRGHPQGRRHLEEGPGVSRCWSQLGRRSTKTTVPGVWRGLPLPGGKCLPTAVPAPVHGGQSP